MSAKATEAFRKLDGPACSLDIWDDDLDGLVDDVVVLGRVDRCAYL